MNDWMLCSDELCCNWSMWVKNEAVRVNCFIYYFDHDSFALKYFV